MIQKGKIIKSDSGRRIRVDGLIKAGGQGSAYWATETNSRQKGVLKVFHKQFVNRDTLDRLLFLAGQNLQAVCPILYTPVDVVNQRDLIGHFSLLANGQPLEEFMTNPNATFNEQLLLAISLARAVSVLDNRHIAHGDLHAENLLVQREGPSLLRLYVIDFDNFAAPGMPAPPCVGHNLYMAPELRAALAGGRSAVPSLETDRFSLGVLMHELILLRHVSAGNDDDEAAFNKAMCSGRWLQDPAAADRPGGSLGGYPVEILNADLARLFRSALSLDPSSRPLPGVWEAELIKAFDSVYCCPNCSGPCVTDVSKVACPLCGMSFPHLNVRILSNGLVIPLARGATAVGRAELGGSPKVSARHAVFRRIGPETWLESIGSNGSYRRTRTGWTRLPDRRPLLVQSGDRLRIGDIEVELN